MQDKTRAHKPNLELGLNKVTRKKKLGKFSEIVKDVEVRLESCLNVEPSVSSLLGTLEEDTQIEEEATPSKLSDETSSVTDTVRKEIPIEVDREIGIDTRVTMAQDGEEGVPPPMPHIGPLIKPSGCEVK